MRWSAFPLVAWILILNKPKSGSFLCEKNTDEPGEQSTQGILSAEGEKSWIIVRIGKIR